ncbi:MAG TPA: hypothetical protein VGN42_06085, partial [Pirellulales bacterium]|nr:hypothetical protein [Pirellulales bacterium]
MFDAPREAPSTSEAPRAHRHGTRSVPATFLIALVVLLGSTRPVAAQLPELRQGVAVPKEIRDCYDRGLAYLAASQGEQGDWQQAGQ